MLFTYDDHLELPKWPQELCELGWARVDASGDLFEHE
jgi:hypothetical protein